MIDREQAYLVKVDDLLHRFHQAEAVTAVFQLHHAAIDFDVLGRTRNVALDFTVL